MSSISQVLEPYILSDRLGDISPAVMKDLIVHYEARGMISSIESCIPHVDVGCLDVHQVGYSKRCILSDVKTVLYVCIYIFQLVRTLFLTSPSLFRLSLRARLTRFTTLTFTYSTPA